MIPKALWVARRVAKFWPYQWPSCVNWPSAPLLLKLHCRWLVRHSFTVAGKREVQSFCRLHMERDSMLQELMLNVSQLVSCFPNARPTTVQDPLILEVKQL